MFASIKSATFLFATLLVFSNLSEAADLCRNCNNGRVTYSFESDVRGTFIIEASGDCEHTTAAKTSDGVIFADLGYGSHEFAVVPQDYSWVFVCDLGTETSGCCNLP